MPNVPNLAKYLIIKNYSNCLKLANVYANNTLFPNYRKSFPLLRLSAQSVSSLHVSTVHPPNTVSDLVRCIKEEKPIQRKLFKHVLNNDITALSKLSEEEIVLILEQCGNILLSETLHTKNILCEAIYENITNTNKISVKILHTYISMCTQNKVLLRYSDFIDLEQCKPTKYTFKLLLWNIAEGDINQVLDLLSEMRNRNISVDREMFDALVFAHTLVGGMKDGESVLETMRLIQISESDDTIFSLYRGVAARNNLQELELIIKKYPISFDYEKLLKIIEDLSLHNNIQWLEMILSQVPQETLRREFFCKLDQLCIFLVHMNKASAAIEVYKKFVTPVPPVKYGTFLFQEMFNRNTQIEEVIRLAEEIQVSNTSIFMQITEIAMRKNKFGAAWLLIEHLPFLRPHFFWPLLLDAQQQEGENGILKTLKKMVDMKVAVDVDTVQFYCLPYCTMTNVGMTYEKFKNLGLPVRIIVNAITTFLLRKGNTKAAFDLHRKYPAVLDSENILKVLPRVWFRENDVMSVAYFIQKACEFDSSNKDLVGEFLIKCLKLCSTSTDFTKYLNLVGTVEEKKLRINTDLADLICNLLSHRCHERSLYEQLTLAIERLMDYSLKLDISPVMHPKNMSLEQLECHLIELKAKDMETRGLIRKLIQKHANMGNLTRIKELREEFVAAGYEESAGMKASVIFSYVQGGHLEPALSLYNELALEHPEFRLDSFKIINLACLMVQNKLNSKAKKLVYSESKKGLVKGGSSIEKNCWKLLSAYENEHDQYEMLTLILEKGYCKPTNVLLGPIVRLPLISKNNIDKAVEIFTDFSERFNCTPLKLEILCSVLKNDRKDLLQKVIDGVTKVHGTEAANEALFMALAETKLEKPLENFLSICPGISNRRLEKVYEKWVNEDKLDCLLTVANAHAKVPSKLIDLDKVYLSVMKIYSNREDCESAIRFYEDLLNEEAPINNNIKEHLHRLVKKCHYQIPRSLKNKVI